jgi:hypothetical protein
MAKAVSALQNKLSEKLGEVRAGHLSHYLGEDGLLLRIDRLKTFRL